MKEYFHQKEILMPRATVRPIFNKDGVKVAEERLDIRLMFEPVNNIDRNDNSKFISHMAGAPADENGRFIIETGADEITWGYGMNIKRTPTYGGEVVQILSTYADKMLITGHCQNYSKQRDIYNYFKKYIGWTTGASGKERRQSFLKFGYPARGWSFIIMVTDIPDLTMSVDTVSPTWTIQAEIVSENDRYSLGQALSNKWSDVLKTPMTRSSRKGGIVASLGQDTSAAIKAAKNGTKFQNFNILKRVDTFQDFVDQFPDAKRGDIAANFKSLIASWATGDIDTLVYNPLSPPLKTEEEIWTSKFGSNIAFTSGGGGNNGIIQDPANTAINYGQKQTVWATFFGPNDTGKYDDGGYKGDHLDEKANWYTYAELSTNAVNGPDNNYNALGGLPYLTPIRVTYKGKSLVLYKRDVGFGGSKGPRGDRAKIDLWYKAAEELGFTGSDYVDIEIGTPGALTLKGFPSISGDVAYPLPKPVAGEWNGGINDHTSRAFGNWQSDYACDLGRPAGTPVFAIADGRLAGWPGNVFSGEFSYTVPDNKTYGTSVHLATRYGTFFYTHLQKDLAPGIKPGASVKAGDLIGYVHTYSYPHLHIGMEQPFEGKGVNPAEHRIEDFLSEVYKRVSGGPTSVELTSPDVDDRPPPRVPQGIEMEVTSLSPFITIKVAIWWPTQIKISVLHQFAIFKDGLGASKWQEGFDGTTWFRLPGASQKPVSLLTSREFKDGKTVYTFKVPRYAGSEGISSVLGTGNFRLFARVATASGSSAGDVSAYSEQLKKYIDVPYVSPWLEGS